jgi:DNA-binding MarR family transcriptional regulator
MRPDIPAGNPVFPRGAGLTCINRAAARPCYFPGARKRIALRPDRQVNPFERLKRLRQFEKRHLPHLRTREDFDIVLEIGAHQEAGIPVNLRRLFELNLGAAATVVRRLARLKQLGIVRESLAQHDGRMRYLTLDPAVRRVFERYGRLLAAG